MTYAALIFPIFWLIMAVGWGINLANVISLAVDAAPVTTLFILKIVGIFAAPLGAVLGLFF